MEPNKKRMQKYVRFDEVENLGKKTRIWWVRNIVTDFRVGVVKWHGAWRKYCFFPSPDTLFDSDCMALIAEFLNDRNMERKL